ncbi:MAG: response regulator [Phycisphaerae bacterium]|nr:response regulator [Phycisphaerae bacterium]
MAANVLIVDDSATMRRMIERTLSMSGLSVDEVHEAGNGIQALAQMAEHRIDVVILDINMPVMSGTQLIKRMHDDQQMARIPVVIASTEGSETRIQELMSIGAVGFVRKPFQPEGLRDVLEPILGAGKKTEAVVNENDPDAF